jgi:hypothetical protein
MCKYICLSRLGEEFDELTADGRKVKSKMILEQPNVMVHEMKGTEGGKDSGEDHRHLTI